MTTRRSFLAALGAMVGGAGLAKKAEPEMAYCPTFVEGCFTMDRCSECRCRRAEHPVKVWPSMVVSLKDARRLDAAPVWRRESVNGHFWLSRDRGETWRYAGKVDV